MKTLDDMLASIEDNIADDENMLSRVADYLGQSLHTEQVVSDYKDSFTLDEIIGFFKSIELYYYYDADSEEDEYRLTEEQQEIAENELYDFDYNQCIKDCYE